MSASFSRPLTYPVFRRLWVGDVLTNLGMIIHLVGASWLMATITDQADLVALVQSANTLPIMLLSIAAGPLADNYDRRRVLLFAQSVMALMALALTAIALTGFVTPWLILALTFLIGAGIALRRPSWQASLGDIVPREVVPDAVSLVGIGVNLTRSAGPALGSLIVATVGAAGAFAFSALCYLPSLLALGAWKSPKRDDSLPRERFTDAIFSGLRYISMSPRILNPIFRSFVFGFGAMSIMALLPIVARDTLQGDVITYGLLLGGYGVGAIGGGLANAWIRSLLSSEQIIRLSFLGIAVSALMLTLSKVTWLTILFTIPAGTCWIWALSLFNVVVQLSTPRWVVGRALSYYQAASFGGMTLGSWIWGLIAERAGTGTALTCAAVALGLGALVGLRYGVPAVSDDNLDPLDHFNEPRLALDLRPSSGPVRIVLEYRIAEQDIPAFLGAMRERRRIRLRDGARRWSLYRDLAAPDRWSESFHFPTWIEYLRHHERRTQADAEVSDRLNALHAGPGKPEVRRMVERGTDPLGSLPGHMSPH